MASGTVSVQKAAVRNDGAAPRPGIACITLSQRLALEDFHSTELRLGANRNGA